MMRLLRFLKRLAEKKKNLLPGTVDMDAFRPEIERYRRLGTRIGDKVRLLGRIDGVNPHLVSIGNCTVIGAESALLTHCPIKGAAECVIGNYVYLAYNVIVLPDVKIGDYCIVGAGSVVTKNIPPCSIAAGNPARVLRSMTEAEKKHLIDTMQNDCLFGWSPPNS